MSTSLRSHFYPQFLIPHSLVFFPNFLSCSIISYCSSCSFLPNLFQYFLRFFFCFLYSLLCSVTFLHIFYSISIINLLLFLPGLLLLSNFLFKLFIKRNFKRNNVVLSNMKHKKIDERKGREYFRSNSKW